MVTTSVTVTAPPFPRAGQFVIVGAQLVITEVWVERMVKVVDGPEVPFNPRRWWKCWGWCACAEANAAKKATDKVVNCILDMMIDSQ